jgi:hypothetical protein
VFEGLQPWQVRAEPLGSNRVLVWQLLVGYRGAQDANRR